MGSIHRDYTRSREDDELYEVRQAVLERAFSQRSNFELQFSYGLASNTMLKGVSAARRTRVNPADRRIMDRRPSPA